MLYHEILALHQIRILAIALWQPVNQLLEGVHR